MPGLRAVTTDVARGAPFPDAGRGKPNLKLAAESPHVATDVLDLGSSNKWWTVSQKRLQEGKETILAS